MQLARRQLLKLAASAGALPVAGQFAHAQAWPSRPLRIVIGYPAGGSTDLIARIIGNWLSQRLGQPVIIENKPGAATNLAAQTVVSAAPDGYTLLFAVASNAINASLYQNLSFNFLRDIAPVAGLAELPLVLEVNPSVPVKTIAEFVAYAKANPGKINIASFGTGTISHLAIELFKGTTGANLVHVPYRGGAPMITDLLSGQVQAAVDALPNSLPHIQRGAVRPLAVMPPARTPSLPDVPAMSETLPGYVVSTWSGIGVPSGTPPAIVERLGREINAGLADPNIKARFAEVGGTPIVLSAGGFGKLIADDTEKWAKVVKAAGVRAE
jgi:tripartite-type tricarboxylate transporter receptor subunit TctC